MFLFFLNQKTLENKKNGKMTEKTVQTGIKGLLDVSAAEVTKSASKE